MRVAGEAELTPKDAEALWWALSAECRQALMSVFCIYARVFGYDGPIPLLRVVSADGLTVHAAAGLAGMGLIELRSDGPRTLYRLTVRGFDLAHCALRQARDRLTDPGPALQELRTDAKQRSAGGTP